MVVGSLGYEWVYPLSTLDSPSNLVTYFKWSPLVLNCLAEDTEFLIDFLETQGQSYETITILGHSLGGVLLGKVLEECKYQYPHYGSYYCIAPCWNSPRKSDL
ncbi:MAG: hypothetical protein CM15mP127_11010 [Gammaproteobacteria bacterium]|nr:MAG: hypothetical protein CM15mP127_11010 [Gammaproteobacteria bacterium]